MELDYCGALETCPLTIEKVIDDRIREEQLHDKRKFIMICRSLVVLGSGIWRPRSCILMLDCLPKPLQVLEALYTN